MMWQNKSLEVTLKLSALIPKRFRFFFLVKKSDVFFATYLPGSAACEVLTIKNQGTHSTGVQEMHEIRYILDRWAGLL